MALPAGVTRLLPPQRKAVCSGAGDTKPQAGKALVSLPDPLIVLFMAHMQERDSGRMHAAVRHLLIKERKDALCPGMRCRVARGAVTGERPNCS